MSRSKNILHTGRGMEHSSSSNGSSERISFGTGSSGSRTGSHTSGSSSRFKRRLANALNRTSIYTLAQQAETTVNWKFTILGLFVEFVQFIGFTINSQFKGDAVVFANDGVLNKVIYFFALPFYDRSYVGSDVNFILSSCIYWCYAAVALVFVVGSVNVLFSDHQQLSRRVRTVVSLTIHAVASWLLVPIVGTLSSFFVCDETARHLYWYPEYSCSGGVASAYFTIAVVSLTVVAGAAWITSAMLFDDLFVSQSLTSRAHSTAMELYVFAKIAIVVLYHVLFSQGFPIVYHSCVGAICVLLASFFSFTLPFYRSQVTRFFTCMLMTSAGVAFAALIVVDRSTRSNSEAADVWFSQSNVGPTVGLIFGMGFVFGLLGIWMPSIRIDSRFAQAIEDVKRGVLINDDMRMYPAGLPRNDLAFSPYRGIEAVLMQKSREEDELMTQFNTTVVLQNMMMAGGQPGKGTDNKSDPHVVSDNSSVSSTVATTMSTQSQRVAVSVLRPYISRVIISTDVEVASRVLEEFNSAAGTPPDSMVAYAARIFTKGLAKFRRSTSGGSGVGAGLVQLHFIQLLLFYAGKQRAALAECEEVVKVCASSFTISYRAARLQTQLKNYLNHSDAAALKILTSSLRLHKEILGHVSVFWHKLLSQNVDTIQLANIANIITTRRTQAHEQFHRVLRNPTRKLLLYYARFLEQVMLDNRRATIIRNKIDEETELRRQQQLNGTRVRDQSLVQTRSSSNNYWEVDLLDDDGESTNVRGGGGDASKASASSISSLQALINIMLAMFTLLSAIVVGFFLYEHFRHSRMQGVMDRMVAASRQRSILPLATFHTEQLRTCLNRQLTVITNNRTNSTQTSLSLCTLEDIVYWQQQVAAFGAENYQLQQQLTTGSLAIKLQKAKNFFTASHVEIFTPVPFGRALSGDFQRGLTDMWTLGNQLSTHFGTVSTFDFTGTFAAAQAIADRQAGPRRTTTTTQQASSVGPLPSASQLSAMDTATKFVIMNVVPNVIPAYDSLLHIFETEDLGSHSDLFWIITALFTAAEVMVFMVYALMLSNFQRIGVQKLSALSLFTLIPRSHLEALHEKSKERFEQFDLNDEGDRENHIEAVAELASSPALGRPPLSKGASTPTQGASPSKTVDGSVVPGVQIGGLATTKGITDIGVDAFYSRANVADETHRQHRRSASNPAKEIEDLYSDPSDESSSDSESDTNKNTASKRPTNPFKKKRHSQAANATDEAEAKNVRSRNLASRRCQRILRVVLGSFFTIIATLGAVCLTGTLVGLLYSLDAVTTEMIAHQDTVNNWLDTNNKLYDSFTKTRTAAAMFLGGGSDGPLDMYYDEWKKPNANIETYYRTILRLESDERALATLQDIRELLDSVLYRQIIAIWLASEAYAIPAEKSYLLERLGASYSFVNYNMTLLKQTLDQVFSTYTVRASAATPTSPAQDRQLTAARKLLVARSLIYDDTYLKHWVRIEELRELLAVQTSIGRGLEDSRAKHKALFISSVVIACASFLALFFLAVSNRFQKHRFALPAMYGSLLGAVCAVALVAMASVLWVEVQRMEEIEDVMVDFMHSRNVTQSDVPSVVYKSRCFAEFGDKSYFHDYISGKQSESYLDNYGDILEQLIKVDASEGQMKSAADVSNVLRMRAERAFQLSDISIALASWSFYGVNSTGGQRGDGLVTDPATTAVDRELFDAVDIKYDFILNPNVEKDTIESTAAWFRFFANNTYDQTRSAPDQQAIARSVTSTARFRRYWSAYKSSTESFLASSEDIITSASETKRDTVTDLSSASVYLAAALLILTTLGGMYSIYDILHSSFVVGGEDTFRGGMMKDGSSKKGIGKNMGPVSSQHNTVNAGTEGGFLSSSAATRAHTLENSESKAVLMSEIAVRSRLSLTIIALAFAGLFAYDIYVVETSRDAPRLINLAASRQARVAASGCSAQRLFNQNRSAVAVPLSIDLSEKVMDLHATRNRLYLSGVAEGSSVTRTSRHDDFLFGGTTYRATKFQAECAATYVKANSLTNLLALSTSSYPNRRTLASFAAASSTSTAITDTDMWSALSIDGLEDVIEQYMMVLESMVVAVDNIHMSSTTGQALSQQLLMSTIRNSFERPIELVMEPIFSDLQTSTNMYVDSADSNMSTESTTHYALSAVVLALIVLIFAFVLRPMLSMLAKEDDGTRLLLKMIPIQVRKEVPAVAEYLDFGTITQNVKLQRVSEIVKDLSTDCIIAINEHGIIDRVSTAMLDELGYTAGEMIGRNVKMIMPDNIARRHDDYLERYHRTGIRTVIDKKRCVTVVRKDGSTMVAEILVKERQSNKNAAVTSYSGRSGFYALLRNVTVDVKLENAQRLNEAVAEMSTDPIIVIDPKGTVLRCNAAAFQTFGFAPRELLGKNVTLIMPATVGEKHDGFLQQYQRNRKSNIVDKTREVTAVKKGGERFLGQLTVKELTDDSGATDCFIGYFKDLTPNLQISQTALLNESIIQISPAPVVCFTPNGEITRFSPSACEIFGYTTAEIVGRNVSVLVGPQTQEQESVLSRLLKRGASAQRQLLQQQQSALHGTTTPSVQSPLIPGSFPQQANDIGGSRYAASSKSALYGDVGDWNGSNVGLQPTVTPIRLDCKSKEGRDIPIDAYVSDVRTSDGMLEYIAFFKDNQEELTQMRSAHTTNVMFQSSPVALLTADEDANILSCNTAAERLLGYRRSQMVGSSAKMLMDPRLAAQHDSFTQRFKLNPTNAKIVDQRISITVRRGDGKSMPVDVMLRYIDMDTIVGKKRVFYLSMRDGTDATNLQEATGISEAVGSLYTVPMVSITTAGIIVTYNVAAQATFGYTEKEVTGRNVKMLMPTEVSIRHDDYLKTYLQTRNASMIGQRRIINYKHKNGDIRPAEIQIQEVTRADGETLYVSYFKDVRREMVLESAAALSSAIIDASPMPIIIINSQGRVIRFSKAASKVLQWREEDIVGKNVKVLMQHDVAKVHDRYIKNYLKTGVQRMIGATRQVMAMRKDGMAINVEISVKETRRSELLQDYSNQIRVSSLDIFMPADSRSSGSTGAGGTRSVASGAGTLGTLVGTLGGSHPHHRDQLPGGSRLTSAASGNSDLFGGSSSGRGDFSHQPYPAAQNPSPQSTGGQRSQDTEDDDILFIGYIHDLSQEYILRQSNELRDVILSESSIPIVQLDMDGRITFANPALAMEFDYSPEELIGHDAMVLVPDVSGQNLTFLSRFKATPSANHASNSDTLNNTSSSGPNSATYLTPIPNNSSVTDDSPSATSASSSYLPPVEAVARRRDGTDFPVEVHVREIVINKTRTYFSYLRNIEQLRLVKDEKLVGDTIIEHSSIPLVIVNQRGYITEFNPAAETAFGYTRKEVLGNSIAALQAHDPDIDPAADSIEHFLASSGLKHPVDVVKRIRARRRDGSLIAMEITLKEITNEEQEGAPIVYVAYAKDLSEEETIESAHALAGAISAISLTPFICVNSAGAITMFSKAAEAEFGYSADEILGEDVSILQYQPTTDTTPTGAPRKGMPSAIPVAYSNAGGAGGALTLKGLLRPKGQHFAPTEVHARLVGRRKDGSQFPMEVDMKHFEHHSNGRVGGGSPMSDKDRSVLIDGSSSKLGRGEAHLTSAYVAAACLRNVTEEVESAINSSAYNKIVELTGAPLVIINERGIIETCNAALEETYGYESKELIGRNVKALMLPEVAAYHDGYLSTYLETGVKKVLDQHRRVYSVTKNQRIILTELFVHEMVTPQLNKRNFYGFLRDLTQQLSLHQAFSLSDAITDLSPVPIIAIDTKGTILKFSAASAKLFEYEANGENGVVGRKNVSILMRPKDAADHDQHLARAKAKGFVGSARKVVGVSRTGRLISLELTISPVMHGTSVMSYVGFLRDMTDSDKLESDRQLGREIAAYSKQPIIVIDHKGIIETINRHAVNLFGYSSDRQMVGKNVAMLMPPATGSLHDSFLQTYFRTRSKHAIDAIRTVQAVNRRGELMTIDIGVRELNIPGTDPKFLAFIHSVSEHVARQEALWFNDALLAISPLTFVLADQTGRIITASDSCCQLFGYGRTELVNNNVKMLMPPSVASLHDTYLANYVHSGVKKIIDMDVRLTAMKRGMIPFDILVELKDLIGKDGQRFFVAIFKEYGPVGGAMRSTHELGAAQLV